MGPCRGARYSKALGDEYLVTVSAPWGDPRFEALARAHATEVWGRELSPQFVARLAAEEAAGMLVPIVALHRGKNAAELVGYNLLLYTRPLLTDEPLLGDIGFYLAPEHRKGWIALALLDAQKVLAKRFQCRCYAGFVADNPRLQKLYERAGFRKVMNGFECKE